MAIDVKICGLTDPESVEAAVEGGAKYIGFVFYEPSPRFVEPWFAAELASLIPEDVVKVGLFVDAETRFLDEVMNTARLDMLQLHGGESPEQASALSQEYGVWVMKSFGISGADDLAAVEPYAEHIDYLLFDAKPPKGATLPGGNAVSFDWSILADRKFPLPWMLAGGLTAANLEQAVRQSGALAVDVSSGVESEPGLKDPAKIREFLELAKTL